MCWVALPWCTSKSTTATRRGPEARAAAAATATLLKRQKPHRAVRFRVMSGRTHQADARSSRPSRTRRARPSPRRRLQGRGVGMRPGLGVRIEAPGAARGRRHRGDVLGRVHASELLARPPRAGASRSSRGSRPSRRIPSRRASSRSGRSGCPAPRRARGTRGRHRARPSLLTRAKLLGRRRQPGQDLEHVAHDPVVGDLEDGRVASLLMATMTLDDDMPARCWIAPLMPAAT